MNLEYRYINKCAETIKNNSSNLYIKDAIDSMINNICIAKDCLIDDYILEDYGYMYLVMKFLADSKFDYSSYGLVEIPDTSVYCFANKKTNERFDILISRKDEVVKIRPAFANNNYCEEEAKTIFDAIKGYKVCKLV